MSRVVLNENDVPNEGDGEYPIAAELHRRQYVLVDLYDPEEVFHAGEPREHEQRIAVALNYVALVALTWQSPVIPWTRVGQLIVWSPGAELKIMSWRFAKRGYWKGYMLLEGDEPPRSFKRILRVVRDVRVSAARRR